MLSKDGFAVSRVSKSRITIAVFIGDAGEGMEKSGVFVMILTKAFIRVDDFSQIMVTITIHSDILDYPV